MPRGALAVRPGQGQTADLGIVRMRILAAGETTGRAFTLVEFAGEEGLAGEFAGEIGEIGEKRAGKVGLFSRRAASARSILAKGIR